MPRKRSCSCCVLARAQAALCAAPPLWSVPVDVLRIAEDFASFVEVRALTWCACTQLQGRIVRAYTGPHTQGVCTHTRCTHTQGRIVRTIALDHAVTNLALDAHGAVFVSDHERDRVLMVARDEDAPVTVLGSAGAAPGQLRTPQAVAVAHNRLFVVDYGNLRVQVWRPADGAFVTQLRYADDAAAAAVDAVPPAHQCLPCVLHGRVRVGRGVRGGQPVPPHSRLLRA